MYRGTTPTLTFTLPIEANTITLMNLALSQFGRVLVSKGLADSTIDGKTVSFTLTEEETLKLNGTSNSGVEIQLRIGVGEVRFSSQIFNLPVGRILQEGKLDEL